MSVVTSQQLQKYYELYHGIDVTFTKEVAQILGFLQEQVGLKILGTQWHCVLYSTSLDGAKIIINLKDDQMEKLRGGSNLCALRYGFKVPDKNEPLAFFANAKIKGFNRYNSGSSQDLYFMTLEFTQKPPDNLIEILGGFLEANVNSKKRRDERIPVNEQIIRKIGFASCNAIVAVEMVDRKCLVRDLSFGGAKLLIPGVAKFLEGRSAVLRLVLEETHQVLAIAGKFVRVDPVEGRRDIIQAALHFDEATTPQAFKMKINEFLKLLQKMQSSNSVQSSSTTPPTSPKSNS